MIDAGANRAREALRVLEDAARFGPGDAALVEELKELRHGLGAVLEEAGLDRIRLVANRDTPGDVGTVISTESEGRREGLRGVVVAAGSRLGEALRSVEESAKGLGGRAAGAAPAIEALRYRAYELERRVVLASGSGRACQWRLCVLITESMCRRPWEKVAAAAVDGGADCLQLREKDLEGGELLRRARTLVGLGEGRAAVVINDRPDIALLSGAAGVHLGQGDLSVAAVRELAGSGLIVGVSTSRMDRARAAAAAGADYCGLGPMFASTTKVKPELRGPGYVREYLSDPGTARVPHLAIGGIAPENMALLVQAGCRGVAVCGAVCGAEDPASVCREMVGHFDAAR